MENQLEIDQVRHVARLARLSLSEEEAREFQDQLGTVLAYFNQLNEVDTTGVAPSAHAAGASDVFREDEPAASWDADAALSNAPDREGQFFRVPKVLEQDGG